MSSTSGTSGESLRPPPSAANTRRSKKTSSCSFSSTRMVAAKKENTRRISERIGCGADGRSASISRCLKKSSEMMRKKGADDPMTPPHDSSAIRISRRHSSSVLFESSSETPTPRACTVTDSAAIRWD